MILLQIDKEKYGEDREELMSRLGQSKIQTRPSWAPIHLQKPYQNCQKYKMKFVNRLVETSLCLPSSTNISDEDLNYVIAQLKKNK